MIPSAFVRLSEMPRMVSGKVDRNALPPYDPTRPDVDSPYEAPGDGIEARLSDTWCFTLGLNLIGVNDNYFDLGGDSTLSVRLFSEIHREFKIELPWLLCLCADGPDHGPDYAHLRSRESTFGNCSDSARGRQTASLLHRRFWWRGRYVSPAGIGTWTATTCIWTSAVRVGGRQPGSFVRGRDCCSLHPANPRGWP